MFTSLMDQQNTTLFLFSYFKDYGDGLHLAWSRDGLYWQALNNDQPFITGQTGAEKLMRDPFLLPGKDGLFHLVWTADWRGKGIGYASSPDLIHWSPQRFLPVMQHEPDACNCWAPEIFYDDDRDQYIIYWATTIPGRFRDTDHMGDDGLNHRMYCVTTRDFNTFSETRLFYDGGFNVIDATVVKDRDRYIMFMKDETLEPCQKNIRFALASDLFGPFEQVSPPITGTYWAEGPSAIQIGGKWTVYFDKYKLNRIGAVRSADLKTWEDISDDLHFPPGAQHGAAIQLAPERVKHLF